VIPALDWTAVGGDVTIAQDAGGHLPQLPVGTGGALRTVTGSVVIDSAFAGGASIFMGCRPGRTSEKRIGPALVGVQVVATPGATVCAPSTVLVAAIVTDAAVCVTPVALHAPVFATAVDGARRPPDAPPANRRGH